MKVIIARISGFCDGVKNAMRKALEAAAENGGVWADGPLVHNRQAIGLLSLKNVRVSDFPLPGDTAALIRAHGVTPQRRRELRESGLKVYDATCGHVARNQAMAARATEHGASVVLAGDARHAEVQAVAASAGDGCRVVASPEDIGALAIDGPVLLLAQTTFNRELFEEIADAACRRFPECRVEDTICRATHDRQREAARLACLVDVLVVVGGKHSANTRRLADVGRAQGKPVFLVETADELRDVDFRDFAVAGVTSGASTPGWITQEVVNRLRFMGKPTLANRIQRLVSVLAESRALTALAAGGYALAAQFFLLNAFFPALAAAGAAYMFFAHTLNRRVPGDPEARRLSVVDAFYQERRSRMLVLAWMAAAASLALAATAGPPIFILFLLAVFAAAAYAGAGRRSGAPHSLRKRIARTISPRYGAMAFGWSLILAGPPAMLSGEAAKGVGAVLFVFLACLGGTLVRDLHDVASDYLMGIDTIPSILGLARARRITLLVLGTAAALPVIATGHALFASTPVPAWRAFPAVLSLVPLAGLILLWLVERRRLPDAVLLQAGVDGMGCLAGVLALAAGALS